jgi:hypothetical protein
METENVSIKESIVKANMKVLLSKYVWTCKVLETGGFQAGKSRLCVVRGRLTTLGILRFAALPTPPRDVNLGSVIAVSQFNRLIFQVDPV